MAGQQGPKAQARTPRQVRTAILAALAMPSLLMQAGACSPWGSVAAIPRALRSPVVA